LLYQDRSGSNPVALQRGDGLSPRRVGLTLQEMLFSHAVLEKLINEFGLYGTTVARYGLVAAVEEMQKRDLHFTMREGYTFRISFDSTSPDLAQLVVTRATELLIRGHVGARVDEVKDTERFLDDEKRRVERELRERESALALFVAKNPEVLEVGTAGLASSDGSGADTASLGLEMQALQLRARLSQVRQQPPSSAQPSMPAVPRELTEAKLRAQGDLAAAQRELTEKQSQFTEEYPDVKRARLRMEDAKARLRHLDETSAAVVSQATTNHAVEPARPMPSDQGEAHLLQQQIELVEKQMRAVRSYGRRSQSRTRLGSDPSTLGRLRAHYVELERLARESREHFALLEDRKFQAEMQALFATQANRADLVVVNPAYKPVVPLRSHRSKILALGGTLSLLSAFSIGLLLALRDDRLRHATDLQRFGLPPLLCEVPPP
jgi:hypothetical protein